MRERTKKEEIYLHTFWSFALFYADLALPIDPAHALHLLDNITWNLNVIPIRSRDFLPIMLDAVNFAFSRERIHSRHRHYIACARVGRNREPPSIAIEIRRCVMITRCVTASNSRHEFIPLIYISAFRFTRVFTSGTKDYIGRECARSADNIFNPLAFTGELYELRRCTLNAVILIGTRARYFLARIYATFPSRIYKLNRYEHQKAARSLLDRKREFTVVIEFVRDIFRTTFE